MSGCQLGDEGFEALKSWDERGVNPDLIAKLLASVLDGVCGVASQAVPAFEEALYLVQLVGVGAPAVEEGIVRDGWADFVFRSSVFSWRSRGSADDHEGSE